MSKRNQACYTALVWTDFSEVCLMRTPLMFKCCSKHKVRGSLTPNVICSKYQIGFNEFIYERETKPPSDPSIMLFDQVILSKRNRGRTSIFGKSKTDFLSDTSDHLWRSASATPPKGKIPGDYRSIVTRSESFTPMNPLQIPYLT